MKRIYAIVILLISLHGLTQAQSSGTPVLQSRHHPKRFKDLPLNREYDVYTAADTFYGAKILGATATALKLYGRIPTGRDTLMRISYKNKATKKWYDSLTLTPTYHDDTFYVAMQDIRLLKRDWFKSRGWMLPFAYFAGGAIIGIVLAPVALINKGKEGFHDWLRFEAVLTGLSAPALFLGTRTHKYDLKQKWKLVLR